MATYTFEMLGGGMGQGNPIVNLSLIGVGGGKGAGTVNDTYTLIAGGGKGAGTGLVDRAYASPGGGKGAGSVPLRFTIPGTGGGKGAGLSPLQFVIPGTGGGKGAGVSLVDKSYIGTGGGEGAGLVPIRFIFTATGGGKGGGDSYMHLIETLIEYATYVLNMDTKRIYEFDNYAFDGIGRFNGVLLGARGNKIYDLSTVAAHDDAANISAYFEIETDFGLANDKAIPGIYLEDDTFAITITDEEGRIVAANISPDYFRSLPRSMASKAFTIKVANISGASVTFRRAHMKVNILRIKGD